eukprot:CAMPEP_0206571176 /NCGR_PEP_ID=MMETSP0325_2-20121206/27484_1 /ASSEMBLY_ACC=CAM_ASM_000347 /TAXON_ID=2866 /ORGANISM="Crypthecodinium cohnii, Strain Seligo" /LENGTH=91 /DNA_ID=CAMNT_0054075119 /DNA_START=81 /DNA_END=353 /DNA_ORIENTATION=-
MAGWQQGTAANNQPSPIYMLRASASSSSSSSPFPSQGSSSIRGMELGAGTAVAMQGEACREQHRVPATKPPLNLTGQPESSTLGPTWITFL